MVIMILMIMMIFDDGDNVKRWVDDGNFHDLSYNSIWKNRLCKVILDDVY